MRKPAALILPKDMSFFDSLDSDGTCPPWLSEEDISYYAEKFAKTGFTGGFNYYRCIDRYVSYGQLTILILQFTSLLMQPTIYHPTISCFYLSWDN
jgi:hypothetical protein